MPTFARKVEQLFVEIGSGAANERARAELVAGSQPATMPRTASSTATSVNGNEGLGTKFVSGGYFSGTVATPLGGTNAKSLSSRPELIASLLNFIVTVFSNWS